jgi:hypothetical protein
MELQGAAVHISRKFKRHKKKNGLCFYFRSVSYTYSRRERQFFSARAARGDTARSDANIGVMLKAKVDLPAFRQVPDFVKKEKGETKVPVSFIAAYMGCTNVLNLIHKPVMLHIKSYFVLGISEEECKNLFIIFNLNPYSLHFLSLFTFNVNCPIFLPKQKMFFILLENTNLLIVSSQWVRISTTLVTVHFIAYLALLSS